MAFSLPLRHGRSYMSIAECVRHSLPFSCRTFQSRSELRSCQLRYEKRLTRVRRILLFHVIRLGFEPKTHSLEGCCSIQLSYRTEPYYLTWTGLERYDIVIVPVSLLSKVDAKIEFILLNSK